MTLGEKIAGYVSGHATSGTLIGNARIYPVGLPEDCTTPAVTYRITAKTQAGALEGHGPTTAEVVLTPYSRDSAEAERLADELQMIMTGARISGIRSSRAVSQGPQNMYPDFTPPVFGMPVTVLMHV